jgi:hypothetical protein
MGLRGRSNRETVSTRADTAPFAVIPSKAGIHGNARPEIQRAAIHGFPLSRE